jgi:hypothetical protein
MLRSNLRKPILCGLGLPICLLLWVTPLLGQTRGSADPASRTGGETRLRFIRGFVVDDRLSALRREANVQSTVLRRLRLGRAVYVIAGPGTKSAQSGFYRVAQTRRTRGWMHQAAIAIPGRNGETERVIALLEERLSEKQTATGIFERLLLCKLVIEQFPGSSLTAKVMLMFGEDAERAAALLSRTARRQPLKASGSPGGASLRDYYLSDASLDRYSRLGIHFDYLENRAEYLYDGQIHRQLLQRYPKSEAAQQARRQLQISRQKLASN